MASTIKLKSGSGAPLSSDLVEAEVAIDMTNKRLYTENSAGTVLELGINPTSLTIGGTALTATAAELNTLDGITATTAELNTLDGITATVTELNYTDGVTSNIQTQLNTKAPIASPTFTGTVTAPAVNVNGTVTADGLSVKASYTELIESAETRNLRIAPATSGSNHIFYSSNTSAGYDFKNNSKFLMSITGTNDISFYEDTGTTASLKWTAASTSLLLTGREASRTSGTYALEVDNSAHTSNLDLAGAFAVKGYYGTSLTVSGLGDVKFYDDANNAKFFWDASAERLNLTCDGTGLNVTGATQSIASGNSNVKIGSSDTAAANKGGQLNFTANTASLANYPVAGIHGYHETLGTGNYSGYLSLYTTSSAGAITERARIDSSGNLLVGTTSAATWTTVAGFAYRPSSSLTVTRSAGEVAHFNRLTSDGTITEFRKDGTTVGSIGSLSGNAYIAGASKGIRFGSAAIIPSTTAGLNSDATHDIGDASVRFRNLYLSGGVYLGGTGAANLLDDYETGTWTPTISVDNFTTTPTTLTGTYVKVGKQVTVTLRLNAGGTAIDQTAYCQISGLPFTCASNTQGGSKGTTNTVASWFDASISASSIFVNNMTSGGAINWYVTITYTVA